MSGYYPGCEFQIRVALADVVGPAKSAFFFDKVRRIAATSSFRFADSVSLQF